MVRINAEIGIMRIVGCRNKEHWQKIGIYMIKYKEKWKDDNSLSEIGKHLDDH
jgi:hypothetical protein